MKISNKIMEIICSVIKLNINDSKSGIMNNTKQELPKELVKYPLINYVNPYKYLVVEIVQKVDIENIWQE